jgi:undecaprenyl-diphosphatase
MNTIEHFNQSLFLSLNAGLNTAPWIIYLTTIFANDFIFGIPFLLLIMWFWGGDKPRHTAIMAFCVCFLSLGFNQLIAMVYQHPRPSMMGIGHTFMSHAMDSSFPSDHMTVFSALALTFFMQRLKTLGLVVALLGIVVGWSRIFLGFHYPLDMLGAVGVTIVGYGLVTVLWSSVGSKIVAQIENIYRKILVIPINHGWIKY